MENDSLQDLEVLQLRSSLSLSYRSSKCSLADMNSDEFYELCKSRLKVSKRNIALLLKVK